VVGVLALQGDVLEHLRALRRVGAEAREVRTREQLDAVDALVLPGGESTTIGRLLEVFDLLEPVRDRIRAGMPVLGTCAGMILLATRARPAPSPAAARGARGPGAAQRLRAAAGVVRRAAPGPGCSASRRSTSRSSAPRWSPTVLADEVEVLAEVELGPVLVRQGHVWAAAFHPELTGDDRLHAAFVARSPRRRLTWT
jgi:pyridoxal 5'-phosphate synthase pdxT subunit